MIDPQHPIIGATDVTPNERLVALIIGTRATAGWCWCSQAELATASGLSRATIKRVLPKLIEKDWLEHQADTRDKRRSGYKLTRKGVTVSPNEAEKGVTVSPIEEEIGVTVSPNSEKGVTVSPNGAEKGVTVSPNSEKRGSQGALSVPPTSTLKDIKKKKKNKKKKKKKKNSSCENLPPSLALAPPQSEEPAPPVTNPPQTNAWHLKNPRLPITEDWFPLQSTIDLLREMHGIPDEFTIRHVPEFIVFWRGDGEAKASWDATLITRTKQLWQWRQQHEAKQGFTDASGKPVSEYAYTWNQHIEQNL